MSETYESATALDQSLFMAMTESLQLLEAAETARLVAIKSGSKITEAISGLAANQELELYRLDADAPLFTIRNGAANPKSAETFRANWTRLLPSGLEFLGEDGQTVFIKPGQAFGVRVLDKK